MKHCVQCGKEAVWLVNNRHDACYQAWKDAGKIQATPWVRETPGYPEKGIRTGGIDYSNHALFCRECGKKIPPKSKRQLYALKRGGECITCDDCHEALKELLRSPTPHVPRIQRTPND